MKFYYPFLIFGLLAGCNGYDQKKDVIKEELKSNDDSKSDKKDNFYYAFKQCDIKNNCIILEPSIIDGNFVFNAYDPMRDEFFIKKDVEEYKIFYKNIMAENIEMGWAKLTLSQSSEKLIFNVDKIFQTYGKMNPIGGGDSFKDIESSKFKESIYYLKEYYDKYLFNQPQKIILEKQKDNTYLLDCKSYMSHLDPNNNYSGIFYGVCSQDERIYFRII